MKQKNTLKHWMMQLINRPSKVKQPVLKTMRAVVLPGKENMMLDEFSGYTKTRIKRCFEAPDEAVEPVIYEIYEPYYEGIMRGKKCLIVHENYEPLPIGSIYTFILDQREEHVLGIKNKRRRLSEDMELEGSIAQRISGKKINL